MWSFAKEIDVHMQGKWYTCVNIYICTYTYLYVCIYVYIHLHMYTYLRSNNHQTHSLHWNVSATNQYKKEGGRGSWGLVFLCVNLTVLEPLWISLCTLFSIHFSFLHMVLATTSWYRHESSPSACRALDCRKTGNCVLQSPEGLLAFDMQTCTGRV